VVQGAVKWAQAFLIDASQDKVMFTGASPPAAAWVKMREKN